jgi:NAD-dependent dihydropyrimidine dehydrogenase PreA subunit
MNSLVMEAGACIGCGRCLEVCPHGVFALEPGRAVLAAPQRCMECGACSNNCPAGALRVEAGVGCAWAMILAALSGNRTTGGICC